MLKPTKIHSPQALSENQKQFHPPCTSWWEATKKLYSTSPWQKPKKNNSCFIYPLENSDKHFISYALLYENLQIFHSQHAFSQKSINFSFSYAFNKNLQKNSFLLCTYMKIYKFHPFTSLGGNLQILHKNDSYLSPMKTYKILIFYSPPSKIHKYFIFYMSPSRSLQTFCYPHSSW